MVLILSKSIIFFQMALFSVRADPNFEGLLYPENQTGSSNGPNSVKINFINIQKPFAYLHYASNMFTKLEKIRLKTVGIVDYTP